jgi:hypothetical protein
MIITALLFKETERPALQRAFSLTNASRNQA